jgi:hypothetical protein
VYKGAFAAATGMRGGHERGRINGTKEVTLFVWTGYVVGGIYIALAAWYAFASFTDEKGRRSKR